MKSKETTTDTLSDNLPDFFRGLDEHDTPELPIATVVGGIPAIIQPGTPEYKTSLEKIYGANPALDCLGRKIVNKDIEVPAKTEIEVETHRVMVFKDTSLEFPELYLRVFLVGSELDNKGFAQMFARAMCWEAKTIDEADLVVFTGGPDVDPSYYNSKPHHSYRGDEDRDQQDVSTYWVCYSEGIPMFGVCRGAQFLAVMNGAKLYQDIDGHNREHSMWDTETGECITKISSVHHQSVIPHADMEILGKSHISKTRVIEPGNVTSGPGTDIEAFFFRDTCCLGVQGHPEYKNYNKYTQWCLNQINECVLLNPDVDWEGPAGREYRRIKPELRFKRSKTRPKREILLLPSPGNEVEVN